MAKVPPGSDKSPEDTNTESAHPLFNQKTKRDRPYLIVLAGSAMGVMHLIDRDTTIIGRGDKADLRLIDDGISRAHTRIVRRGPELFIEDLGSTNGTFCNGVRISSQPLAEGDKVMIGASTILKFTYHDQIDEVFQQQLTESALRDPLTKIYNKKFFLDRIQNEFSYAERHRHPLTLLFLDIDRFKSINDNFGHPAGDYVLQQLANLMERSLRNEDVLARYGGEEFAVICRGLDLPQGEVLAERIRKAVDEKTFEVGSKVIPVTVSIGLAKTPDPRIRSVADLIVAADEVMYQAKRAGRHRVCVQGPPSDDDRTDLIERN